MSSYIYQDPLWSQFTSTLGPGPTESQAAKDQWKEFQTKYGGSVVALGPVGPGSISEEQFRQMFPAIQEWGKQQADWLKYEQDQFQKQYGRSGYGVVGPPHTPITTPGSGGPDDPSNPTYTPPGNFPGAKQVPPGYTPNPIGGVNLGQTLLGPPTSASASVQAPGTQAPAMTSFMNQNQYQNQPMPWEQQDPYGMNNSVFGQNSPYTNPNTFYQNTAFAQR